MFRQQLCIIVSRVTESKGIILFDQILKTPL